MHIGKNNIGITVNPLKFYSIFWRDNDIFSIKLTPRMCKKLMCNFFVESNYLKKHFRKSD